MVLQLCTSCTLTCSASEAAARHAEAAAAKDTSCCSVAESRWRDEASLAKTGCRSAMPAYRANCSSHGAHKSLYET